MKARKAKFAKWLNVTTFKRDGRYYYNATLERDAFSGSFEVPVTPEQVDEARDAGFLSELQTLDFRAKQEIAAKLRTAVSELVPSDQGWKLEPNNLCLCHGELEPPSIIIDGLRRIIAAIEGGKMDRPTMSRQLLYGRLLLVACRACVQNEMVAVVTRRDSFGEQL